MKRPRHGICSTTPKGTIAVDLGPVIDDTPIVLGHLANLKETSEGNGACLVEAYKY
jgi:hypothetical protein